jgi:hypothetical protein
MDHRNPKDEPPIPVYRFWLGLSKLSALLSEGEEGAGNMLTYIYEEALRFCLCAIIAIRNETKIYPKDLSV